MTLKPALALLWETGVRLIPYIHVDDMLVLAQSQEMAKKHVEGVVYLLQHLGFQCWYKHKPIYMPDSGLCDHGVK